MKLKGFVSMAQQKNVRMAVENDELVIRIALKRSFGTSSSGKSEIIATTSGNVSVPGHESIKIGLNVYRPVGR